MSKRERESERKVREEQEATAYVFQEFIRTFQDVPTASKTFVKSGVLYADKNQLEPMEGQLYNPTPVIKSSTAIKNALECAKILKESKLEKAKKKEKPKSNLELLKEELKLRHSEKDERERLKEEIIMTGPALSYFDGGDPNSTNLFVANLDTSITETNLMEEFGKYGPLASVKIMWPRGEEKFKNSNTNCGFVAYMSRRDAERALSYMKNRTDMRVGWGKSVDLPTHPIYIPQELLRLYLPPPQTGLPFNAQANKEIDMNEDLENTLYDSVVKVTIPLNKKVLALVNRVVEFVVKEGPLFEAMIMNNELGNPDYNFLFENKSPIHVYYRLVFRKQDVLANFIGWKLFSILQGEATKQWSMTPFRMFLGGSVWLPPVTPNYCEGMPDELIKIEKESNKLSENQCDRLVELIQNLTISRMSVAEAMVFCFNHLSAINDWLGIIVESLSNVSTLPPNKIARLYLLSDVLSNCVNQNVTVPNIRAILVNVIEQLRDCLKSIPQDVDKQIFASKVLCVIHQLDAIGLLSSELFQMFEGYFSNNSLLDGVPLDEGNSDSDEPLDGASLLKRSLKNNNEECIITHSVLKEKQETKIQQQYFVPSKWDSIDPGEVEEQAMSSTKLYYMQQDSDSPNSENQEVLVSSRKRSPSPRKNKEKSKRRKSERADRSPGWRSSKSRDKRKRSYQK